MRTVALGCTALLALGIVGGCSDDPVGRDPALTASTETASLSRGRGEGDGGREILILDDCDPDDPAWAPTGGCLLKDGRVTNAEFNLLTRSPLSLSTVGHPAWRNQPSYLDIEEGEDVKATNAGGRLHTLTRVENFGGGRVPPLNVGLVPAPECTVPSTTEVAPGETMRITGLGVGLHRFQCCIHPWMRELIAVGAHNGSGHQH
jgi:plastocyanin